MNPPARLFVGSSREGKDVARNLQAELEGSSVCEVDRWDNIFEPSSYPLEALTDAAARADFAVLIATPDDITLSRQVASRSIRDNVIFEFGLFIGALGRERVYLLSTGGTEMRLPSDLFGLTRLDYSPRADGDVKAALNSSALQIQRQIRKYGLRRGILTEPGTGTSHDAKLAAEIDILTANAESQGWTIKKNDTTTLRLKSPRGTQFTLTKSQPESTRMELRRFAAVLRSAGLRVNSTIRRPIEHSPL